MTSEQLKKRSVPVIPTLLAWCLGLNACASLNPPAKPEPFDGKWEIVPVTPFRSMACLEMEDVQMLREYMLRRCSCELQREKKR